MVDKVFIIPTGDEILNGTVIDTNSSAIMEMLLENFPACEITRTRPVYDLEEEIIEKLDRCVEKGGDLIFLIGGSGGGHRYIPTLGKDYTHSALTAYLSNVECREIYGPNGHLWSKLVVGEKLKSLIVTVPGPFVEAVAAAKAAIEIIKSGERNLNVLVEATSKAVFSQYPSGGEII
ncbi:molybdopterin-binding protein [Fonticella tunisiensis]|uniref:Putative molybdopterin binding protein n=1 Tax=Fonticella tunisiensis TaxID=1096341 RepID=A0A4R7KRA2_9CLOT|nr:molybdopterin-binding protein [Fonticella tunisiensis]TDT61901.1 putative molybdopterin binding protein [Fonticella tunisiensis]